MNTPTRLTAFGLGLVAVFGAALGVGRLAGPAAAEPAAGHDAGHSTSVQAAADLVPGGLQVSERGFTLQLAAPTAPLGSSTLRFRVLGPDGQPVGAYQQTHERELHLVVVQRDLTDYRHLHPARDAAGTWSVPVDLRSGSYRVFADFQPVGQARALTLGADLAVSGSAHPGLLPDPATQVTVDDYAVTLDGTLAPGATSRLSFAVSKGGVAVRDLQPYLGAAGHLVALRAGDLAYLHVHPTGDGLTFDAEVPSPGAYRLYLEFQHAGVVRTAEFTAIARAAGGAPAAPLPSPTGSGHGDDGHGD